jgi:hypothetical protein
MPTLTATAPKFTIKANICKCNNCDTILIDENPQINAKEYVLKGGEKKMRWFKKDGGFWGCPKCETDGYLKDL